MNRPLPGIAVIVSIGAFACAPAAFAQRQSFDLATFTPPTGWERIESPGLLTYRAARPQGDSAQLFLFPSHAGAANPADNFDAEWQRLVTAPLGPIPKPQTQTESVPEGWTAVSGAANVNRPGAPFTIVLSTATGHGRTMSVVVNLVGQGFAADVEQFFRDLAFSSPTKEQPAMPAPTSGSVSNYIFTAPQRWTSATGPDGIVLTSPTYNNGERCQLRLLPMRKTGTDLMADAIGAFRELFRADPLTGYPTPTPSFARGVSPFGWQYVVVKKSIGGNAGDYGTLVGI
ncbi:MAG TPA: hypothetical protein VKB34_19155, partial [Povalibacter sp.]|nr:hypothetical protein [Povalibacter sp.]